MRLLLSGGSHRATLGSIGAIGYFLWSDQRPATATRRPDRWSDVEEIVSVSGGSLLNAALAGSTDSAEITAVRLAEVRRRIGDDGLLPYRTIRRCLLTALGLAVLLAAVWLLLAALGVAPPDVLSASPWAVLIGIAIFPLTLNLVRRIVGAYQRDVIDVVTGGSSTPIDAVASARRHTICASGLASGLPYYFTIGGAEPFEPAYGTAIAHGYSLSDAATASMALPGLGRVRAPRLLRREVLVDGGVSGGFGEQVGTTIRRRPEDTWRSDGEWFAIDAVRHMDSNSRLSQRIQSLSMISLLGRWLKVSLEATYVNDLVDLGPGQYARVWSANVLPPAPTNPRTTFRDGSSLTSTAATAESPERRRLAELQARVAAMGLFSMNPTTVDLGIVVGFASTLEVRHRLDAATIAEGLAWLDTALDCDGQLSRLWTGDADAVRMPAESTG